MIESALTVAPVPVDMTTPDNAQVITTSILGAVVGLMLLGALYLWKRTGNPAGVLVLIGGLICSANEPAVDVLGLCYFPEDGWTAFEAFDREMPVWLVLAYVGFFGGLTYLTVLAIQRGATRRQMWVSIAGLWVINLILELPILASDLYQYYGDQTFEVAGFPLNWLFINSFGSLLAATVIVRLEPFLTGPRKLLLLVIPQVTYMASWALAGPHFYLTNSEATEAVRYLGSITSAVITVIAIDYAIRIAVRDRLPGWPVTATKAASREPVGV